MSKERQQQLKGAKYNDSDEEELSLDLDSDELGGQDDTLDDLSDNDSEYHLPVGTRITFNLENNKEHNDVEQLDQIEELEKQIAMMKMDQKDEDKSNQTLQRILTEPIFTDELSLGKDLDDFLEELDIHSSANETSTVSKSLDDKSKKDTTKSILKNEKLKAMSTEIYKPSVNAKVGKVVSIRVSKKYTAFGTDRGLILIFSSDDQELKCILGNTTGEENVSTGKVSSLSFSFQEDWLVAGYEKGVIIVWDVIKASVIKRIDDAFTSPVVNVAFLTDMYSVIASELYSSTLKCFALSKVLFRYSYSLMFQMSVGDDPIITLAVIPKDSSKSYLAVGTRSGKLLLYSMAKTLIPDGEPVTFGYPPFGKGLLPYVALANSTSNLNKIALVAFAYGKDVNLIEISKDGKKDIIFNTELTSDVCGLGWFDEKSLVIMTADQEVLLFDVRVDDTSVIEVEDITFTNPLDHYAMQGSKHSSYDINARGFVVLGDHGLVKISIKPWEERIYQLSDAGLWKEALDLTHEFYTGKGKCVFGLPTDSTLDILAAKTVGLVTEYLRLSLTGTEYKDDFIYKIVGSTCIDNCMKVGREDVVFSAVHTTFEECGKTLIFLELLEPFILSGALKSIPWQIFQGFISHFRDQQERLDTLIMRLDLQQYNMYDKIIQFCRECSLLKTYVHVTNIYQREYVEPLEKILEEYGESREREVSEVILYFFERYLVGNVPEHEDLVTDIKKDVVDFIFDEEEDGDRDPTAAFHSIVRHFPERLFDVLEIAMNDDSATNPWDEDFTQENLIEYILRLQQPHQFMKHPSFYDGRIAFFSFYAKFLAKGILKAEDYNILLVIFTFLSEDILRRLRNCTDDKEKQRILSLREDREERFIEILEKRKTYYDKTKFMELAKRFDLYKVAKFFMSSTQKYQWYLEVNLKRLFEITWSQIPELAEALVVDLSFSNACHQHVVMTVQKLFDDERDPERYRIIRFFFYCYITALLLDPTSENGSLNMNEVAKRGIAIEELTYTYLQMVCDFEENKKVKEYLQQQGSGLDVDRCMKICKDVPEAKSFLLERTGEVKHALNEILRELENTVDLLKLKLIDEVSRKRNAIFEKNFPEISKDFNLITDDPPVYCPNEPIIEQMKVLQQKPKIKLPKVTLKDGYDPSEKAELTDVLTCQESRNLVKELKTAINLCCENSERKTLDDVEVRQLWFRLLNTFVLLQRRLRYGFLEGKPLNVSKREEVMVSQKRNMDSEGFDEFDLDTQLDEFDIIKEEIVDTNTEIIKIEKDLNAERELHDPDEERIERLQIKLKKKKDHIHNLQMQLKSLEEKEKLEKQLEEERNNDPTAPHNIQKLANLWLQRCNSLYIRIILSEMMRYVDIPSILNDIVTEHDSDSFGHVKVTIMRLLDNYSYESGLLKQSNELISYDIFNIGNQLHRDLNSALKPNSLYCFLCGNPLGKKTMEDSSMCRIFPCGHAFHVNCIGVKQVACVHCENKDEKELIQIAKTSRTYIMEGRKAKEDEGRGKFFDFHQVKSTVDKALDKRPPIDLLDDLSLKKNKGPNAKKKNAADIALEQLSAPSSSSVTRLTGIKILQLAPENLGNGRSNNRSNANKVTLVAIDEHQDADDEVPNRDRASTVTEQVQKPKRRIGPVQKITIVDFEEIVKEIEEMYD